MSTPIIQLEHVKKTYKDSNITVNALKDVNLSVSEGEIVFIMGPSGSGKSTTLHIISFLDTPTDGKRIFMGKDMSRLSEKEAAQIRKQWFGFVFQEFNLLPELTVWENIALPIRNLDKKTQKNRITQALEYVGLSDKAHRLAYQLSGGERQRASIARAIASQARIVVMDEPTGNVDSETEKYIAQMIIDINNKMKTTFIIATHSMRLVNSIPSRIIHIEDGRIPSSGAIL